MEQKITGGCLCGAVRYEIDEAAKTSWLCHCRDCQKAHGSAYFPAMMFLRPAFHPQGSTTGFTVTAESGAQITREFCPTCGSTLFLGTGLYPDIVIVAAGSLDDPSIYKPKAHAWAGTEWSWAHVDDGLERFPGQVTKRK